MHTQHPQSLGLHHIKITVQLCKEGEDRKIRIIFIYVVISRPTLAT